MSDCKYKGKLTISKVSSTKDSEGSVSIQLKDEASKLVVLNLQIEFAQFAKAILGLGDRFCTFDIPKLSLIENVGKSRTRIELKVDCYDILALSDNLTVFERRELLLERMRKVLPAGYVISDDGFTRKQPGSPKFHVFYATAYVEAP